MKRTGDIVQWNNKAGFGFVRDDTGRDYYLHISNVEAGARPRIGDQVSFDIGKGRKGRPAAVAVTVTSTAPVAEPTLRSVTQTAPGISRFKIGLRTAAATIMTILIVYAVGAERAPLWLILVYAIMGTASALLYRFDKLYALTGKYRVSETNLHSVDLCFGIIGGLAAQEVYRHKTVKPRFVATTWTIALAHTLGLAALAFGLLERVLP